MDHISNPSLYAEEKIWGPEKSGDLLKITDLALDEALVK